MAHRRLSPISVHRVLSQAFHTALEYHCSGFLLDAAELYAEICALDPLNADARFLLGVIARQTRRLRPAARLVTEAIRLNPGKQCFRRELELIEWLKNAACTRRALICPGSSNAPGGQAAPAHVSGHNIHPAWMPLPAHSGPGGVTAHA